MRVDIADRWNNDCPFVLLTIVCSWEKDVSITLII